MIARHAVIAIALVATLAGCAQTPAPIASPSPVTEVPTPTPTTTPTPTPEPTQPALDELVVSPDGLSNLRMGEAPPVVDPALDIVVFVDDYCAEAATLYGVPEGKWVPNYEPALTTESRDPFEVRVVDDRIKGIALGNEAIRTEAGLGLGSSVEEIMDVYPDALVIERPRLSTTLYVIEGEIGRLVFEVGVEGQSEYPVGRAAFVRVDSLDTEVYGWANTGANYFACYSG